MTALIYEYTHYRWKDENDFRIQPSSIKQAVKRYFVSRWSARGGIMSERVVASTRGNAGLAWSSAVLLSSFALTMTIALGLLAPLGYGVFTAIGAALLLGAIAAPQTLGVAEAATDTNREPRRPVPTDVLKI
jgi:hypothetical protein